MYSFPHLHLFFLLLLFVAPAPRLALSKFDDLKSTGPSSSSSSSATATNDNSGKYHDGHHPFDGSTTQQATESAWRHRETHHTVSSVTIASSNNATLWAFPTKFRSQDDSTNKLLQFKSSSSSSSSAFTPLMDNNNKIWKYEFSCETLPKMALSSNGNIWAVACPSQRVRLHNGDILTSEAGTVSLFRWYPSKQKARILQTIYGHQHDRRPDDTEMTVSYDSSNEEKEEEKEDRYKSFSYESYNRTADDADRKSRTQQLGIGQGLSMSAEGNTVAIIASSYSLSSQRKGRRTASYRCDIYHYRPSTSRWERLGKSIPGLIKGILSANGTILAGTTQNKKLQVYSYHGETDSWQAHSFPKTRYRSTLTSSSLSLAANGLVLSQLQASSKHGGAGVVYIYHRRGDTSNQWYLDSMIPAPPSSSRNERTLSFGWITSLSQDGLRIAIGEPAYNQGVGAVFVYDYLSIISDWKMVSSNHHHDRKEGHGNMLEPTLTPLNGKQRDSFGRDLDLTSDGNQLVVRSLSQASIYEYRECVASGSPQTEFSNNSKSEHDEL